MHPILFEAGTVPVYSYGFMIGLGIVAGMSYLIVTGRKEVGLSFDQANTLFLAIFAAALIGGKFFLFLEGHVFYFDNPGQLFTGRGFVFYGSFLFAIPTMWWFFRRNRLPAFQMLDIMAVVTCLVHAFGRLGCFLAGCCYGVPTDSWMGVVYTDTACYAEPLHTPLVPIQLLEACYILMVMFFLLNMKKRRIFYGQLFLTYLLLYAAGRFVLEFFRGDTARGFLMDSRVSHSQFIALCVAFIVAMVYFRWARLAPARRR